MTKKEKAPCNAHFTKTTKGYPSPVHAVCGLDEGHEGEHEPAEPLEESDEEGEEVA